MALRNAYTFCSSADFPDADMSMLGLKGSPTQVERIFPPETNNDKVMLDGTPAELADELYRILGEAKFI